MKVAVTIWEDRISPLLDAARRLLVAELQDSRIVARYEERLEGHSPLSCAELLDRQGIQVLICGGISEFTERLIRARGIQVHAFTSGKVADVLADFLQGRLEVKDDGITPRTPSAGIADGKEKDP